MEGRAGVGGADLKGRSPRQKADRRDVRDGWVADLTAADGTGGGKGAGRAYLNGKIAHKLDNIVMIEEIGVMFEAKAAELNAVLDGSAAACEAAE